MTATDITVDLLRGSVPAACYTEGTLISATITQIEGLEALEMEIVSITVGEGDTDEVVLRYDADLIPAGAELEQCNLASFQCICDCCSERTCYEVIGPLDDVLAGVYHVGFLPGDTQVDQLRFYSPTPGDTALLVTMRVNGDILFENQPIEDLTIVDRTMFSAPYDTGLFPADAELTLEVIDPAMYTYNTWKGLTVCLLGLKYVEVQATFDFVVDSYEDLEASTPGHRFYDFPYVYEMTDFGIVRHAPDTEFDAPV